MKKKYLFIIFLSILAIIFISCGSPLSDYNNEITLSDYNDEITLPYDKTEFTYSINDAI